MWVYTIYHIIIISHIKSVTRMCDGYAKNVINDEAV